eukprot:6180381-Alexandrium_andersonii.AAC.1
MCIRDSPRLVPPALAAFPGSAPPQKSASGAPEAFFGSSGGAVACRVRPLAPEAPIGGGPG